MKLLAVLLEVFLIMAVVGSSVANEERVCPPEANNPLDIFVKTPKFMKTCYKNLLGSTDIMKGNDTTIGPIQDYFTDMCEHRVSTFLECTAEKAANLEVCADPSMIKLFNIMRDIFLKTLESGCADGGKRFVALVQGLKSIPDSGPNYEKFQTCSMKRFTIIRAIHETDSDLSSKLFVLHKEYTKLLGCMKLVECEPQIREVIDYFTNEITNNLKCIHPQDGNLVPCVSIRKDMVKACCICGMKTHNSKMDIYDTLEMDSGKCFYSLMTQDLVSRDVTTYNDHLRADIKNFCETKRTVNSCLEMPTLISEDCIKGALKTEFNLWIDFINNGMDVACLEDGKRMADIMIEVYRLKKTGQGHAVWDCVDVAKSTRNVIDEHRSSSKNMRFYHEVEAFKECLVNKLHNDQTSVEAVTSLVHDLLNKVECVSDQDGSTLLCEALMHNNHHHHH